MAIAALLTRSLTQYRAGRHPLPGSALCLAYAGQEQAPGGACDRERGTGPAPRPAALAALNDAPHRPAATALSVWPFAIRETTKHLLDHAAGPVAARIHFESRP